MPIATKSRKIIVTAFAILAAATQASTADPATASKSVDTSRIVSVGGDVTEILFALGAGERIVALDTTSQYPPEAVSKKASIGYMRALSSEGVLATNPSVIIASDGAGPPEVIAALKSSAVPFITIKADDTAAGVESKVRLLASTIAAGSKGDELVKSVAADFAALEVDRMRVKKPVRALFVLALQGGRAMVGGRNTGADAIFHLAGAENVATDIEGYKPLSDEAALTMAPDVIVVMKRGPSSASGSQIAADIAAMPGLGATPAARTGRIGEVDGSYVLQFGPRAASAARDLMHMFYPDLARNETK